MQIIYLIVVMVAQLAQWVCKKQYNNKVAVQDPMAFNGVSALTSAVLFSLAAVFFAVSGAGGFRFDPALIPYILGFTVSFGSAAFFSFMAVQVGSMSLTSLAISYSLVIPTLYGMLFMEETPTVPLIIGVVLLLGSLFLVNRKKGDSTVNLRWLVYALLGFLGNGVCSTVQTAQQKQFDGNYKSEFMMISMLLLAVFFFALAFICHKRRVFVSLKQGWPAMMVNGLCNGTVNLFVMLLVSSGMAASVMFPVISGGGLVLTTLLSVLVYREKLSVPQYIGLAMGTASVVLMNL